MEYAGGTIWHNPTLVAFDGGVFAYVKTRVGIIVLNMIDPLNPQFVSRYFWPLWTTKMAVHGNALFMTDEYNLLHVIDISNPYALSYVDTYRPDSSLGRDMVVSTDDALPGDNLYIIDNFAGIFVFNIDEPLNPELQYNIEPWGTSIVNWRRWIFTAVSQQLRTYNSANFSHCDPALCYENVLYFQEQISGLAMDDGLLSAVSYNYGAYLVDVSSPTEPVKLDSVACSGALDSYIYDSHLYVGCGLDGLYIYDITDPSDAILVNHLDYTGNIKDAVFTGNYGIFPTANQELKILDISDPANADWVAFYFDSWEMTTSAREVELVGDHAIVGTDEIGAGLTIIDISDPTEPYIAASDGYGAAYRYFVQGDKVYKAQESFGLGVTDISDILNPIKHPDAQSGVTYRDVVVKNELAYVAADVDGFKVFDVSDPDNPFEVWSYSDGFGYYYRAWSVTNIGNYIYWGDDQGTWIYDISDPKNPVLVDSIVTGNWTYDVAFSGNIAIISERASGLRMVDISDPAHPITIGFYSDDLENYFYELVIIGNYCFIADDGYGGFRVMDVSDPTDMRVMAMIDDGSSMSRGIDVRLPYVYLASNSGFHIFKMTLPCDVAGDANADGSCNIGDAVYLIQYIFNGGPAPANMEQADANADFSVNVGDAVYIVNYIFKGGPSPNCSSTTK